MDTCSSGIYIYIPVGCGDQQQVHVHLTTNEKLPLFSVRVTWGAQCANTYETHICVVRHVIKKKKLSVLVHAGEERGEGGSKSNFFVTRTFSSRATRIIREQLN